MGTDIVLHKFQSLQSKPQQEFEDFFKVRISNILNKKM